MHTRSVTFFDIEHRPDDPLPHFRYQQKLNLEWLRDDDGMPRQEVGHGETQQQAEAHARLVAATFMADAKLSPDGWPANGIDNL